MVSGEPIFWSTGVAKLKPPMARLLNATTWPSAVRSGDFAGSEAIVPWTIARVLRRPSRGTLWPRNCRVPPFNTF